MIFVVVVYSIFVLPILLLLLVAGFLLRGRIQEFGTVRRAFLVMAASLILWPMATQFEMMIAYVPSIVALLINLELGGVDLALRVVETHLVEHALTLVLTALVVWTIGCWVFRWTLRRPHRPGT